MELRSTINDSYTIAIGKRVESNCLSINFLNKTTSNPVAINGVIIAAGEQFRVTQTSGFIDTTTYDIQFQAGAGVNEVVISRILVVK
jgi:hypothetical protein